MEIRQPPAGAPRSASPRKTTRTGIGFVRVPVVGRALVLAALLAGIGACGGGSEPPDENADGAKSRSTLTVRSSPEAGSQVGTSSSLVGAAESGAVARAAGLPACVARSRVRDNGDGTVTDLGTGLVWEKKCSGCGGLHDAGSLFYWSSDADHDTVWDWLDELNAEGGQGLAGHGDWRIPNIKELLSLVDYARADPSVDVGLDASGCVDGCDDTSDATCSCTSSSPYWTSTTFADFPAHALVVDFGVGLVGDELKTQAFGVRAVRGGDEPDTDRSDRTQLDGGIP